MAYVTRCTCTDHQLAHVGCDCDHTGPERLVKSTDEIEAEIEAAYFAQLAREQQAEIDYFDRMMAEDAFDVIADPREDFAEYTIRAIRHQ